ncbi:ParB/RepB/Spo0J family partition protein [Variovorax ginsengisoli]|uniref:ParB family chromosome partitioning protein n=1 Tax=Variovorax ginsengisoli TaxID=363844 RepID=A0ABT9SDJ4_9BURK|nr:ParB/RepB/Spo0J family partition protein [Variovorax ginsengisoli]MDP9902255.1 ParB family chromosome partitioning protein [Variovorax ginsengisoli]
MGLRDKASKIDFGSLVAPAPQAPEVKQPKTAPGAMMAFANDQRSELLRENELLRGQAGQAEALRAKLDEAVEEIREWDGAKPTRLFDPKQIIRSNYANRHEASFLSADFDQLKREIEEAGGNVQPIKVRALTSPGDGPKYEIVFGHRRHEACLQLGLPVLAVVDNLDDRALFVEMDRENRERSDLSAWEQGVMYARALDAGLFPSARQLSSAIGVDPSNLGKAIALARLPEVVIAAFASPLDLQFRWVPSLNQVLEQDSEGVKTRAAAIAAHRGTMTAKQIFEALIAKPQEGGGTVPLPGTQLTDADGKVLATVKFDNRGRAAIRVETSLGTKRQQDLLKLLDQFLNER